MSCRIFLVAVAGVASRNWLLRAVSLLCLLRILKADFPICGGLVFFGRFLVDFVVIGNCGEGLRLTFLSTSFV